MCYSSNAFFVAFFYAQNDTELKDVKVSVAVKFIDNQTKAICRFRSLSLCFIKT